MGETSSLSFLHFLKRTIKGYIGSVPFTEEGVPHVTLDPGNSGVENEIRIISFDERRSLLDSYLETVRITPSMLIHNIKSAHSR